MSTASTSSSASATILGSAKKPVVLLNKFGPTPANTVAPKPAINNQEFISSFKKSLLINQQHQQDYEQHKQALAKIQQPVNPLLDIMKEKNMNLETTYILNSPTTKSKNESMLKHSFSNYECTPLQPPKLKNADNYDVSDLRSEDDTDDEEEPSKPIPQWAKEPFLSQRAHLQSTQMLNFTKLFKASSSQAIVLDSIFKLKRKKFYERSSSANWSSPPVWSGNGLNGEESFYRLRKNF